ncbi:Pol polyprotein [Elysia marginata]|uniref:Pol polyprotein n=1 Tax=Elysia marginata TaxID=1093978 RepID=A0AAV4GAS4_9GAST|nr:Pol polyprotein [Elysia marginata]
MSKLSDPWTARQQRHLAFISELTTDIMHVSGKSNMVADCLSRAALSNVVLDIDYDAMAKAQKEDKDIKAFPTAITEDLGTSAAELVYGTPLSVPGEFIDPTPKPLHACTPNDPFSTCVRNLSPLPTSHHGLPSSSSVPQALRDAQFVFVRHDGHRGPLRRPYDGPFRVVASGDKTFRIMIGSREEVVSTDRLKAAHVDLTGPVTVAQPPRRDAWPSPLGARKRDVPPRDSMSGGIIELTN